MTSNNFFENIDKHLKEEEKFLKKLDDIKFNKILESFAYNIKIKSFFKDSNPLCWDLKKGLDTNNCNVLIACDNPKIVIKKQRIFDKIQEQFKEFNKPQHNALLGG